jgi:hypothetical protein
MWVVSEAGADRQRGLGIEAVSLVDFGHVRIRRRKGRDGHVGIDAEQIAHRNAAVGGGAEQRIVLEEI